MKKAINSDYIASILPAGAELIDTVTTERFPIGAALVRFNTGVYALVSGGVTYSVNQHEARQYINTQNENEFIRLFAKHGISQTEAAQRFGIPLRTLQGWCNGTRKAPDYIIKMMAEILSKEQQ